MYSWTDTSCSGKHYSVDEFVEGKTVIDTGFSSYMGYLKDLTIYNVIYSYYTLDGTTIILEHNNTINI